MIEKDGVWRMIRGRRVFIRKGQSLSEAMRESGKFENRGIIKYKDDKIKLLENFSREDYEKIVEEFYNSDKTHIYQYVFEKYGYNKKYPSIVDEKEFNKINGNVIFRGYKANSQEEANEYYKQFISGDIYSNTRNAYGNGIYFTRDKEITNRYNCGDSGFTIEAKLKDNAKVLKLNAESYNKLIRHQYTKDDYATSDITKLLTDAGSKATMMGYDAIEYDGIIGNGSNQSITLILNRDKIVVKEKKI